MPTPRTVLESEFQAIQPPAAFEQPANLRGRSRNNAFAECGSLQRSPANEPRNLKRSGIAFKRRSPINLRWGCWICLTMRRWSARPRCVCVLPMSKRRIIFRFFHGDVAADDAFEPAVLGAKQQSAVGIERLGAALDFSIADMNRDAMPDGGAMFLPLVGNRLEPAGADAVVIAVEFLKDFDGEGGAVLVDAGFDFSTTWRACADPRGSSVGSSNSRQRRCRESRI